MRTLNSHEITAINGGWIDEFATAVIAINMIMLAGVVCAEFYQSYLLTKKTECYLSHQGAGDFAVCDESIH